MDKRIGAQYYTIRDHIQTIEDFDESCRKVKEIGYQIVQISGTPLKGNAFVNTYYYIKSLEIFLDICRVTGKKQYLEEIRDRIRRKKAAMVRSYFSEETGDFAENEQGANAFALDLGLGDGRTFENMVSHYVRTKQYDTGIFGTDVVTRVLLEKGRPDVAVSLLASEEKVSFYSHMRNGGTTLLEHWDGDRSHCHPMFGAVTKYLFAYILGIRQTEHSAAYESVVIEPTCMAQIPTAKGGIETVRGKIGVEYDPHTISVTIPENMTAVLILKGTEFKLTPGMNTFNIE